MQAESEAVGALPAAREHKLGFMSRRRRLRNRWNIHMRKDERAQAKAWAANDVAATAEQAGTAATGVPKR